MMEMRFWAAEDIELADDHQHFVQLAGKQQSLVLQILCLLRTNDDFLQQSAVARLAKDIQSPEARCFFGYVLMQRNIHAEVLDNALRALGGSETQINHTHLLEAAVALPCAHHKLQWFNTHITDSEEHFAMRLVAFAVYTAVFQTSMYDIIFHLASGSDLKMPGTVHGIAKIRQDHTFYTAAAPLIQQSLIHRPETKQVHAMVSAAVEVEMLYIDNLIELFGGSMNLITDIDAANLKTRVKCAADSVLAQLGYSKLYSVKDMLNWITIFADKEARKHDAQEDVVEKKVVQAAKSMVTTDMFSVEEDF